MWIVFGAGLVLCAAVDAWYLATVAVDGWDEDSVFNALWPASILLIAWAGWQPRRAAEMRVSGRGSSSCRRRSR